MKGWFFNELGIVDRLLPCKHRLFKKDGETQKVSPFKQGGLAKELGISILKGKKLF